MRFFLFSIFVAQRHTLSIKKILEHHHRRRESHMTIIIGALKKTNSENLMTIAESGGGDGRGIFRKIIS